MAYYATQDPELAKGKVLFYSIKEMAEFHAREINLQQDKEKIILIGSSFGGNVAMEMVSPLTKLGLSKELQKRMKVN